MSRPAAAAPLVGFLLGLDVHLDHAALAHAGLEHRQGLGVAQLANLRTGGRDMGGSHQSGQVTGQVNNPTAHGQSWQMAGRGCRDCSCSMHCLHGWRPLSTRTNAAQPASKHPAHQGQVGHLHESRGRGSTRKGLARKQP